MIHLEQHGPVVAIRMARALFARPIYWTAAYWVDGLLIDTGPSCTANELLRALGQLPVEQVVLTHSHEDHIGGLAAVRQRFPTARIYAAQRALSTIQQPERLQLQLYRRLLWGIPQATPDVMALDEIDNQIRTSNYLLRVVETPGYSLDHISLFEPHQRWLFCGDAYMEGKDEAWTPEFNMFGIVSSLRTLASLRPEKLFSGSGTVHRTPQPELHAKIRQLVTLAREVARLELIGLSAAEIVACLFKEESRLAFLTRGHFSAQNLVEACRAYNAIFTPELASPNLHSASDESYRRYDHPSIDPFKSEPSDENDLAG
ncbi:MAG: MBL fold metallo-hydrolase [Caldilineaceae bacterium]